MKMLITTKNKKEEKVLRDFLTEKEIDFTVAQEDAAVYKTATNKILSKKNIDSLQSVTPEWQKQFVRKSIKKYKAHPELLISEKDAWKIIDGSK